MPRLKLTVEYVGTAYVGWQRQKNGPSVQEALEKAVEMLLGEAAPVVAAGRTDAGVHALGQVVSFSTTKAFPLSAYTRGLNGLLPKDISVTSAEEVDEAFDPRRWASGKRYRYRISNRQNRSALRHATHWELFAPLDLQAMQEAAQVLVGRHDFSAFRASDCAAAHAVREVRALRLFSEEADELILDVEGTAFLKHMVRNMVGSLVEVGKGRRPVRWVEEVLASRDRTQAGPTAPPQGLTLREVMYEARSGPLGDADVDD